MSRKMYWGLSILIVIFIAGGVFVFVKQQRELAELRQGVAEADKLLADHQKQQPKADNKPPRPAQEGFEWEWHGDHWHEMPIAQNDVPQQTPIVADIEPAEVSIDKDYFNFSVELPTDAELPKYSKTKLTMLVYEAGNELSDAQRKYEAQSRSLVEAAGAVDTNKKDGVAKMMALFKQDSELGRVYYLLSSERNRRISQIRQYIDTLE